jgi:hypothetical protein
MINPQNGYKYNSKYSKLSPEEILNEKRKKYKEWLENLPEDKRREVKNQQSKFVYSHVGTCELCGGHTYSDIYQHRRTKKHQFNESNNKN